MVCISLNILFSFQYWHIITKHEYLNIYIYRDRDEILLFAFDFFTCCIKYCSDIKFGPAEIKIWYICVSKGKTMGIMCIYIYIFIDLCNWLLNPGLAIPSKLYTDLLLSFDRQIQSLCLWQANSIVRRKNHVCILF